MIYISYLKCINVSRETLQIIIHMLEQNKSFYLFYFLVCIIFDGINLFVYRRTATFASFYVKLNNYLFNIRSRIYVNYII